MSTDPTDPIQCPPCATGALQGVQHGQGDEQTSFGGRQINTLVMLSPELRQVRMSLRGERLNRWHGARRVYNQAATAANFIREQGERLFACRLTHRHDAEQQPRITTSRLNGPSLDAAAARRAASLAAQLSRPGLPGRRPKPLLRRSPGR